MGTDLINQVILNQYRVDAFIASGGMGAVYRVWDLKRNVSLAMKVLHSDLAEDPAVFKRFQREANALKKLAHPNIVPFYGLYQTSVVAFLLERYVDGPSLKEIIRERHGKPMPTNEVLIYQKALCAALGYAHANGVVHCDVKPGNVMIDQGGNIYLTDFGIARHAESTTTTLATTGTAAYMAPEQIRGEPVSPATDVYALGIMLFEMLTGQRPFRGDEKDTESGGSTANERIRYGHLTIPPPDPRTINPAIPPLLAHVIIQALEKDPSQRFSSTRVLFAALCSAASTAPEAISELAPMDLEIVSRYRPKTVAGVPGNPPTVPPEKRSGGFMNTWHGWVTAGVLGLLVILACFFLLKGVKLNIFSFPVGVKQTPTISEPPATIIPSATPRPTYTATLIPSTTPTPTETMTPTPTSTPLTILKATDDAEMVFVPAGDFNMGSSARTDPYFWGAEGPPHKVYLDGFWIYRTEVTNAMYQACVAEKACPKPEKVSSWTRTSYYDNPFYANYPVVYVSYVDASAYCLWAGGRLPTEAEWEKAARGTDERLFPWGNDLPTGDRVNLCDRNCPGTSSVSSIDDGYRDTAPVGNYPLGASPYGVLDMAGNVSEWTADWMNPLYYEMSPENNPLGPASGTSRVCRGGSFFNPTDGVRTVGRFSLTPSKTLETIGFRCVNVP